MTKEIYKRNRVFNHFLKILLILSFITIEVNAQMPLGINIQQPDRRGYTFNDLIKSSRSFTKANSNDLANVDSQGWPTEDFKFIAFDTRLFPTFMATPPARACTSNQGCPSCPDDPQAVPFDLSGNYTLYFEGSSNTTISVDGTNLSKTPYGSGFAATVQVPSPTAPTYGNILEIKFTNTNGGARNIRLMRPGVPLTNTSTYTDAFINLVDDFPIIRSMDFCQTNHYCPLILKEETDGDGNTIYVTDFNLIPSPAEFDWADRRSVNTPSQFHFNAACPDSSIPSCFDFDDRHGVAWEHVIELANETSTDLWINIPVPASNDYIEGLARLLEANLTNPDAKIYIEYGNELWNYGLGQNVNNRTGSQYHYNTALAEVEVAQGNSNLNDFGETSYVQWGFRRHVRRLYEISQIFACVYGEESINNNVRVVYGIQIGGNDFPKRSIEWFKKVYDKPLSQYVYGIAGGDYFGPKTAGDGCWFSEQQVLNLMQTHLNGEVVDRKEYLLELGNEYDLVPLCYEGGSDTGTGYNNINLDSKVLAERNPQIGPMIEDHINQNWFQLNGGAYMYYKATSAYTRFGCWGITEDPRVTNTTKIQALNNVRNLSLASNCSDPQNLKVSIIKSSSVKLDWDIVGVGENYEIQYKRASDSNWTTESSIKSFLNITGLLPKTKYNWRVRTNCSSTPCGSGGSICSSFVNGPNFYTATSPGTGYKYLRFVISGSENAHIEELKWLQGSTEHPTQALSCNDGVLNNTNCTPNGYKCFDNLYQGGTTGGTFRAFDHDFAQTLYFGTTTQNDSEKQVTLEYTNNGSIAPTGIKLKSFQYGSITNFRCEASTNNSTWDTLYYNNIGPSLIADELEFLFTGNVPERAAGAAACQTDIVVPANHSNSEIVQASNSITSSKVVAANLDVTYKAGNIIRLLPGFHAQNNAEFTCYNETCQNVDPCVVERVAASSVRENLFENKRSIQVLENKLACYPNPFSDKATIEVSIPKSTQAKLIVTDLAGNEIESLIDGEMLSAGTHKFILNKSDSSRGVLLITLITDDYIETQKITAVN